VRAITPRRHLRNSGYSSALRRRRRAFTLVEAVVACVVFAIGVLGLQAAATVVVRQAQDARDQSLAAEVAAARFESFVHESCTDAASGSDIVRGVDSRWQTAPLESTAAGLSSQTIRFGRGPDRRVDSYSGAYRCR
jgi:Tfp pilus assembly protein PilV